jgi:hypothetical protein
MGSGYGLLAPVPDEHIASAKRRCDEEGAVAFGTRRSETFSPGAGLEGGDPVYIYASHLLANGDVTHDRTATWRGQFVEYVPAQDRYSYQSPKRRKGIAAIRPETCLEAGEDDQGPESRPFGWWVIEDLKPDDRGLEIREFKNADDRPILEGGSPPRYPLVVRERG